LEGHTDNVLGDVSRCCIRVFSDDEPHFDSTCTIRDYRAEIVERRERREREKRNSFGGSRRRYTEPQLLSSCSCKKKAWLDPSCKEMPITIITGNEIRIHV
jgi:hypothetical protein